MSDAFDYSQLPPAAQATLRAGQLMQKLLADPDAAKTITAAADKAAKKDNPAHQTREEIAAPFVQQVLEAVDKRFAERDAKTTEQQQVAQLESQIQSAIANEGFTQEGIKNILETMQKKGIADFDVAKKAYRYDNPAPTNAPRTVSDSMYWNVDKNMQVGDAKQFFFPEGLPAINENPEVWEKETALKYLNGETPLPTS